MKDIYLKPLTISKLITKLFKDKKLHEEMKKGALKTADSFLSYEKIAKRSINFNS